MAIVLKKQMLKLPVQTLNLEIENEDSLDVTINNMLIMLEQSITGNFIGVVDNFEKDYGIDYMPVTAQTMIQMKCTYITVTLKSALHHCYRKE
eukprot:673900-Ditylum_brightwellii.AAC.2